MAKFESKGSDLYIDGHKVIKGWESFGGNYWFAIEKVNTQDSDLGNGKVYKNDTIWYGYVQGMEEEWGNFADSDFASLGNRVWAIKKIDLPSAGRRGGKMKNSEKTKPMVRYYKYTVYAKWNSPISPTEQMFDTQSAAFNQAELTRNRLPAGATVQVWTLDNRFHKTRLIWLNGRWMTDTIEGDVRRNASGGLYLADRRRIKSIQRSQRSFEKEWLGGRMKKDYFVVVRTSGKPDMSPYNYESRFNGKNGAIAFARHESENGIPDSINVVAEIPGKQQLIIYHWSKKASGLKWRGAKVGKGWHGQRLRHKIAAMKRR